LPSRIQPAHLRNQLHV